MTDLRKAAEMALEVMEYNRANGTPNMGAAIEALRQALEQPEQEPVAWLIQYKTRHDIVWGSAPGLRNNDQILGMEPLYTAPPKREWVGLTKEDMPVGDNPIFDTDEFAFGAAWAQAKLKEKNT